MKYKYLLPVAVLAAFNMTEAKALEDITSELYLPNEFETFSDTSISYNRTNYKKNGTHEDFILREEALLGVGEETAVLVGVGNRFNFKRVTDQEYNNNLNLDYELGMKKNLRTTDGFVLQAGGSYYTYNPRSWYGHSGKAKENIREINGGNTRWYKALRGDIKLGYELEDGLLPYASFGGEGNIDDADREIYYQAFAGVHKLENGYSFDTGLRYEFDFGSDKVEAWHMQGAADYFLTDNMTLGGYLDYQFASSGDPKVDYDYSVEARFKVLF